MPKGKIILVDKKDREIGLGEKMEVHKKGKLHRCFSVFVFNRRGEILLQKRARGKYHSGGLWTNTCCSHPRPGKDIKKEAELRLKEEMGIAVDLREAFSFIYKAKLGELIEYEFDHVFFGEFDGKPKPNKLEAEDWKWISPAALRRSLKSQPKKYTVWFKKILDKVIKLRAERKILPTITTTWGSDWQEKIKEINRLKLKEIALFPTCLKSKERARLYSLLEKSTIKRIPFVHLRSDMEIGELDYLAKRFKTQAFNIHSPSGLYPLKHNYSKYKKIIYVENTLFPLKEKEIKEFAGICLDFTHLEDARLLNKKKFNHDLKMLEKYKIGANHVSAIKNKPSKTKRGELHYDRHHLDKLSEVDYLKRYPLKYFSSLIAIELDNTIKEQLKVKKYILKIIKQK